MSYHSDIRGSTTLLTDEQGSVTDRYTYGIYGELEQHEGSTHQPLQYNGRDGVMTDPNGLYYMRARYYDPQLKRFLNRDVILGDLTDGQTLNRFAYVNGDPVGYVDPLGLFKCKPKGTDNVKVGPNNNTTKVELPEVKSPNPVKIKDVINKWDEFLGEGQTNINPLTRKVDSERIFSADQTRAIRFSKSHEMPSMNTTKAHYHEETWIYDAANNTMTISNLLRRIQK